MKYIIKENKLDSIVKKYLDSILNLSDLHFMKYVDDDDGTEIEDCGTYYFGDYYDEYGDLGDIFGIKYGVEYFTNELRNHPEMFPAIDLNWELRRDISSMFADKKNWEKPFLEWFNEKTGDNIVRVMF